MLSQRQHLIIYVWKLKYNVLNKSKFRITLLCVEYHHLQNGIIYNIHNNYRTTTVFIITIHVLGQTISEQFLYY